MPENVVIGGGVYGAGVALELAGQGREVRLLENRAVASSASGGPGLTNALADRSRHLGAMISEQTQVTFLDVAGDRVSTVTTDAGEVIPVKDHLFVLCNFKPGGQ